LPGHGARSRSATSAAGSHGAGSVVRSASASASASRRNRASRIADVGAARAQRRHVDHGRREPVEQRAAKPAGAHRGLEVGVGRRDDHHVDRARRAADRLDLAGLERAQHHRLDRVREIADLVEEHHAGVGALEVARPLVGGAGERAALVAEQLGGGDRGGDRGDVDADVGPAGARSDRVQRARDQLLAGSGLTLHEDRPARARRIADLRAQRVDGGAGAEQAKLVGAARIVIGGEPQHHAAREHDLDASRDLGRRDAMDPARGQRRAGDHDLDAQVRGSGRRADREFARLPAGTTLDPIEYRRAPPHDDF